MEINDDKIQLVQRTKTPGCTKKIHVHQVLDLYFIIRAFDTVMKSRAMVLCTAIIQKIALIILFNVNFIEMYKRHMKDISKLNDVSTITQ